MRWSVTVAAAAFGAIFWPAARSPAAQVDVVELKDGHQVVGEVVHEKSNAIYVDLGFDVIRIPRDQIISRKKPGQAVAVAIAAAPAVSLDADPTGFFKTSLLKPQPVKELVHKYG
jgi:serine protease Do